MRKLAIISALLAACGSVESSLSPGDGGTDATTGTSTDAAARDAVSDAVVDAGLIPEGVTKIVVTTNWIRTANYVPCGPPNATYTIALPARELSWKVCKQGEGGAFYFDTGQKTLSPEEYATIDAAVHALTLAAGPECVTNEPSTDITFTTPSRTVVYYEERSCLLSAGATYVKGIFSVMNALDQYAR